MLSRYFPKNSVGVTAGGRINTNELRSCTVGSFLSSQIRNNGSVMRNLRLKGNSGPVGLAPD